MKKRGFAFLLAVLTAVVPASAAEKAGPPCVLSDRELKEAPFLFFNVVSFAPGREEQAAKDVMELKERSGIDVALYCLTLHPEGRPASAKAKILIASFRKFRDALKGSGVRAGVLIQSILGHWPRVDKDEEPWTRTVDCTGATPRFCPLDPDFRKYIAEVAASLAREGAAFLLTDDDLRMFSPKAECFCVRHTARFNEMTGNHFTPEEFRKAVLASKVGDPVYQAYEKLRVETVCGVASLIRQSVDAVNPAIPAGICAPGREIETAVSAPAFAIAGKHPTVMRINSALYRETDPKHLPENFTVSQARYLMSPGVDRLLDEADTWPHTLYSMSAQSLHAKLVSAIFAGARGAKVWHVNDHKGAVPVTRKYTDVVSKYSGFYQTLAKELRGSAPMGIRIPVHKRFDRWHPTGDHSEEPVPDHHWCGRIFGQFGIPFTVTYQREEPGVYAIAGAETVARMTDEEIRTLFRNPVLTDGPAAVALTRRCFAEFLGVSAKLEPFRCNREFPISGGLLPLMKDKNVPLLSPLPGAKPEVISRFAYVPFSGSPDVEYAAPASVLFRNASGALTATVGVHPSLYYDMLCPERKAWLLNLLDRLNGKPLPFVATAEQPVMLQHRRGTGGDVLGIFNLGRDPLETVTIRCAAKPERAEVLIPSGAWEPISFSWENSVAEFPVRLECCNNAVLRLHNGR